MTRSEDVSIDQSSQAVWDRKAGFWDDAIGAEGNIFHQTLVAPAVKRLLEIGNDERVLDVACGNGQFSRELAGLGAQVLAVDFSSTFLDRARQHTARLAIELAQRVTYRQVDATDEQALRSLGTQGSFDAVVCNMALMDMPTTVPLMRAVMILLRPGGRFVFSTSHPCFNQLGTTHAVDELDAEDGKRLVYSIKIPQYLTPQNGKGIGIRGEPEPHDYWDRPLHAILKDAFDAGLVLDGMEEPAFPPDAEQGNDLGWGGKFSEIPPVLVGRLRRVT